ncbi:MAG TPA: calcium/sodium antiporter [Gemmatimonadaceae bacterium]|nr:calcium/sodium antiporter [Gemmatimonadaceae bacterium]
MTILLALLLVLAGLALLAGGGDILIRGAVSIARLAGLTTAVIGLTVVALGTSLPELVVSLLAASRGQPDIAVGNVVGSNIFNIAAILGVTAVIRPVPIHGAAVKVDWPIMVLVSALGLLVMRDGAIDRFEGAFFVMGLIGFVSFSVWLARREVMGAEAQDLAQSVAAHSPPTGWQEVGTSLLLVAGGLIALVIGGRLLVDGAVQLARLAGVTERVIGLTIVAAGTSAPEMAASVAAARKGHSDIAVANLLGSNIFNILGILGATALVTPIPVALELVRSDAWWMMGVALVLFPLMRVGRSITRLEGGLLFAGYVTYVALLLM